MFAGGTQTGSLTGRPARVGRPPEEGRGTLRAPRVHALPSALARVIALGPPCNPRRAGTPVFPLLHVETEARRREVTSGLQVAGEQGRQDLNPGSLAAKLLALLLHCAQVSSQRVAVGTGH